MKVVIVNNSAVQPHFGCLMVMRAYKKLLKERDVELIGMQKRDSPWYLAANRKMLDKADLVLVNGEGSIHHNRRPELLRVGFKYPAILMNCVFQEMDAHCGDQLKAFKLVTVRESFSADYMEAEHEHKPEIIPDLIFSNFGSMPRIPDRTDTFLSDSVVGMGLSTIRARKSDYLKIFNNYARACCGRFHTICLAAMLGIPFSAWRSNSWKNKAIMTDMGIPDLYRLSQSAAINIIPDTLSPSVTDYASDGFNKINKLFDDIANNAIK